MAHAQQATVTRLLKELQGGNQAVFDELFGLVYGELKQRAHQQRRRWHRDYTFNTTALVHEAYLKLVDQHQAEWTDRAHFLSVAAKVMRHLLIDYARRRRAQKRGGDQIRLSLEDLQGEEQVLSEERAEALVALDEALERLARISERQSRIVECRFFGGMTIEETAEVLALSPSTVKRGWAMAQAWLHREMSEANSRQ